jgi:hypothetical protein
MALAITVSVVVLAVVGLMGLATYLLNWFNQS